MIVSSGLRSRGIFQFLQGTVQTKMGAWTPTLPQKFQFLQGTVQTEMWILHSGIG